MFFNLIYSKVIWSFTFHVLSIYTCLYIRFVVIWYRTNGKLFCTLTYHPFVTRVPRRVPHVEQELFFHPEHLSSLRFLVGFLLLSFVCSFVVFILVFVFSFLLRLRLPITPLISSNFSKIDMTWYYLIIDER